MAQSWFQGQRRSKPWPFDPICGHLHWRGFTPRVWMPSPSLRRVRPPAANSCRPIGNYRAWAFLSSGTSFQETAPAKPPSLPRRRLVPRGCIGRGIHMRRWGGSGGQIRGPRRVVVDEQHDPCPCGQNKGSRSGQLRRLASYRVRS